MSSSSSYSRHFMWTHSRIPKCAIWFVFICTLHQFIFIFGWRYRCNKIVTYKYASGQIDHTQSQPWGRPEGGGPCVEQNGRFPEIAISNPIKQLFHSTGFKKKARFCDKNKQTKKNIMPTDLLDPNRDLCFFTVCAERKMRKRNNKLLIIKEAERRTQS